MLVNKNNTLESENDSFNAENEMLKKYKII